jgi:peptide deformylase
MHLKIVSAGELVLRQPARLLDPAEIHASPIQELIAHLRETLRDAPGVGLAAPQVGQSLQLAIIEDLAEYHANLTAAQLAERERVPIPFHVIINPVLHLLAPPEIEFFEGCLSVPGYTAVVARSRRVRVQCLDQAGMPRSIEASGWYARILQHEIDHLNGTLYLDRMDTRTFCTLDNHARHWKTKSIAEVKAELNSKFESSD